MNSTIVQEKHFLYFLPLRPQKPAARANSSSGSVFSATYRAVQHLMFVSFGRKMSREESKIWGLFYTVTKAHLWQVESPTGEATEPKACFLMPCQWTPALILISDSWKDKNCGERWLREACIWNKFRTEMIISDLQVLPHCVSAGEAPPHCCSIPL